VIDIMSRFPQRMDDRWRHILVEEKPHAVAARELGRPTIGCA
jgi:hypothetical protein